MNDLRLSERESKTLDEAALFFKDPGTVMKGLNWMGKPIEAAQAMLPARAQEVIHRATEVAVKKALVAALTTLPKQGHHEMTMPSEADVKASGWLHKGLATASGVAGGLFGLAALPVELPITTLVLLRGIADQARLQGHRLDDPETQLECLMVFAMGTPSDKDDKVTSGYFTSRLAFTQLITQAGSLTAGLTAKEILTAIDKGTVPVLVRLISKVAEAFQIRITQKAVSESLPVLGAVGGGALNYAFSQYFVAAAKYHFAIRAMEKTHGLDQVQDELRLRMSRNANT